MSSPEPKLYQSKAIEEISDIFSRLLRTDTSLDRRLIFHSPVGSGKTLTMAYALAKTNDNPINRPFIILWLSPGKGGLHLQSARALESFLADSSVNVQLLDQRDDIAPNVHPTAGTLFVVNWEKLHSEKDGAWANKILRDGETPTLFALLKNATDAGLDMITVIDESHTQLDGPRATKLMADIDGLRPSIRVEMSATPNMKYDPSLAHKGLYNEVYVQFDDVEAEGMVRRCAMLNEDFASVQARHNDVSLDQQALWGAWEKLEELTQRYRHAGSSVTPLLLIQYPDGAQAGPRASVVEQFLEDRGLVPNKTYATWLSGNHSDDLEKISLNSSPYRALIFKQAIATGWDCPRAQVLVQFRNPGSKTFQIQTLGRILRTPERRHYDDEALNIAYVYSDLPDISVEVTSTEKNLDIYDRSLIRGSQYPSEGLKLTSVFQPRRREFHYPIIEHLEPTLRTELNTYVRPLLTDSSPTPPTSRVLIDSSVDIRSLLGGVGDFSGEFVNGVLSDVYVQVMCDQILTYRIGPYSSKGQSRARIKRVLLTWFSEEKNWSEIEVQYFIIANPGAISTAINEACVKAGELDEEKAIADARAQRHIITDWEIPEREQVSSLKWKESKNPGLLFKPALLPPGRSKPESRFEQWLGEEFINSRVQWWWKNGVRNERYLGVIYEYQGREEITYPDYLVMSKSDVLWVVEIKDIHDPEGDVDGKTASKAKGLLAWAQQQWPTRAVVAVPQDDGNGGIVVKMGDALSWQPSDRNWSTSHGWTVLNMDSTL